MCLIIYMCICICLGERSQRVGLVAPIAILQGYGTEATENPLKPLNASVLLESSTSKHYRLHAVRMQACRPKLRMG